MQKYCDLHTHTTGSDGSETVGELIERAKKSNISVMALTDHNWSTIIEPIKHDELLVLPGVEFDSYWIPEPYDEKHDTHVVGVFPRGLTEEVRIAKNPVIERGRERFVRENIRRLNNVGFDISYDELIQGNNHPEKITRGTIAELLVHKGFFHSTREVFAQIIGRESGKDTYVPIEEYIPYARIQNILNFIVKQHGLPIVGHPLLYGYDEKTLRHFLQDFQLCLPKGYPCGIEVYYGAYSMTEQTYLHSLADEYGMFCSAGSDSHGPSQALAKGDTNLYYAMCGALDAYWKK